LSYKKVPKGWYSADCEWRIPKRKTPIAYSTKATMDYIVILAQEGGTIQDIYNRVTYCEEGKKVLQTYIDRGFENIEARIFFRKC
jgi:hypothetical protein